MTELLEQVIAQIEKLPPDKQDAIATLILEELEEDQCDRSYKKFCRQTSKTRS